MKSTPEVAGRLCHLNALPNLTIRRLERSVIEGLPTDLPHVYLCSSLKEEFGIAILEAMSAGLLAVAPVRGGVGNYVNTGENGFLIDTSDADRLRGGMESVLLKGLNPEDLKIIAERGRQSVHDLFNIRRIADIFNDFYRDLLKESHETGRS
jgi:glycosyltransferase involved in cell wall biosynthesis